MSTPVRKLKRGATVAASKALVTDSGGLATTASNLSAAELDRLNFQGANIASASNIDLGAATGDFVSVTGTTSITALGTVAAGIKREVRFTGALTLTHNGTSLILPTSANITTAADDCATFVSLGSGNWICTKYARKNGTPLGTDLSLYKENPIVATPSTTSGIDALSLGSGNTCSGTTAPMALGHGNTASGSYSTALGYANTASGDYSTTIGTANVASGDISLAIGLRSVARIYGQIAHASGRIGSDGDAQSSTIHVFGETSNATQTELFADGISVRITIPDTAAWAFKILVVARRTDADGENDGWEFTGLIHRDSNAASTTLDALQANQIGATAWSVDVDADTTNGSLRLRVTGEAAKTIRWLATVTTSEVTE